LRRWNDYQLNVFLRVDTSAGQPGSEQPRVGGVQGDHPEDQATGAAVETDELRERGQVANAVAGEPGAERDPVSVEINDQ
jgi:hypothetical protein